MYNGRPRENGFSELAMLEYNKAHGVPDEKDYSYLDCNIDPSDPVMIEVVKRLGRPVCGGIEIAKVPLKYAKYYRIEVFDGYEHVYVDYNAYKLDEIRALLDDESVEGVPTLSEKIKGILDEKGSHETD